MGQIQVFHVILHARSPRPPTPDNFEKWMKGEGREPVLFFECAWISDGIRERIQMFPHEQVEDENGRPINIDDYLRDGDKEYWLANWDWDSPQEITPTMQGSVMAEIRPQTAAFRTRDPAWWLLRLPRFETPEPRLTLREYVARFEQVSCVEGESPLDPVQLRLHGDTLGLVADTAAVEIYLEPKAGYHISRMVRENSDETAERMEYQVEEFMQTPSGAYFPRKVVYRVSDKEIPDGMTMGEYEVVTSSFDEPLDPSLFTFRFPENAQVVDTTDQRDPRKWLLWGKENQAKADLQNPMDLLDYDPVARSKMPGRSHSIPRLVMLNLIFLGAVLAVAFLIKRRRSKT
ncbi:MAG: hypothetical protein RIK87_08625 [Fuerstiella sp.]